jgi:hypothetical protein
MGLPVGIGRVINTLLSITLVAILYRYWLATPVLQYVSIGRWRILAIVVAAACGGVLSLLRLPVLALACGSMGGLLLGGTWAAWRVPNDAPVSVGAAFASHLGSFWREVIILTVAVSVGELCCARFTRRRFPC